jgi:hypothetical protein
MAGRDADDGRRKPSGSGWPQTARRRVGKHGPGDGNRRRGAPRGAAPWRQGAHIRNGSANRRATPRVLRGRLARTRRSGTRGKTGIPGASTKNTGDNACLDAIVLKMRILASTMSFYLRFTPSPCSRIRAGRMLRIKAIVRCVAVSFLAISARFSGRGEAPSKRPSSTSLAPGGGVVFRQPQFNRG